MTTTQPARTAESSCFRRLPIGAEVLPGQGVHFRLWAPRAKEAVVVFENDSAPQLKLERESSGYFSGKAADARSGMLYRFRFDGRGLLLPDPASRFQPEGPHGPSQIMDPSRFHWTDDEWRGISADGQVLYEMHIGTFTPQGTFAAALEQLKELRDFGITCVEVMPVADFPGRFGWGYDGVNFFAPTHLYGQPDDFRRFIDHAHSIGLGVILDVVYNHFGPDGNYLKEFSPDYFTDHYKTDWGEAINYDGENSAAVREFFISNARHWIEEYHLDGFRFDATQNIYDSSREHILTAVAAAARRSAGKRSIYLINENEPQHTTIVLPREKGGYGMDALWNDDFHHTALVTLTGRREAYYTDYRGTPQEFISAAKFGYLFQGQRYKWQKQRRGTPTFDLAPTAFINFIENHDQVANSALGLRTHEMCGPGDYRAMVALPLLMPGTPMLFQGQEFAASSPFFFFADHNPELNRLIRKGRADFLKQFPSAASPGMEEKFADPSDIKTFERCKLDLSEIKKPFHAEVYQLYRDLLRLRKSEPALRGHWPGTMDGAVLGPRSFCLRFFCPDGDDRLAMFNFDGDYHLEIAPEPLLAPPLGCTWRVQWSSEDPKYGGHGTIPLDSEENWWLPGHSAVLLQPAQCGIDERNADHARERQRIKK